MITKKVNRYYCEFCKKSGGNAGYIKKHEMSCTLNPHRICRVCQMDHGDWAQKEKRQSPLITLIELLPDPNLYHRDDEIATWFTSGLTDAVNKVLPKIRELSSNCPACILAAIRQKGIPVPMVTDFSFTKEMKEIWDEINDMKSSFSLSY